MTRAALVLASYAVAAAVLSGCALVVGALLASGALRGALAPLPDPAESTGRRPGLASVAGIHRQQHAKGTPWT